MTSQLRGRISANVCDLNALHAQHQWLPNEHTIRPTSEVLEEKRRSMEEVERHWLSVNDYILYAVFGYPVTLCENNRYSVDLTARPTPIWVFAPSLFPYAVPTQTNHWVLWHGYVPYDGNFYDELVNRYIRDTLRGQLGHDNFQFAWYKNPKPTVPQYWHVQVFWTEGKNPTD
jgi:hypothetical protein